MGYILLVLLPICLFLNCNLDMMSGTLAVTLNVEPSLKMGVMSQDDEEGSPNYY